MDQFSDLRWKRLKEEVEVKESEYAKSRSKLNDYYESEIQRHKTSNKKLQDEVSQLKFKLQDITSKYEKLKKTEPMDNKSFNQLNIQYNKLLVQNQGLEEQVRTLKGQRKPLKIKQENQQTLNSLLHPIKKEEQSQYVFEVPSSQKSSLLAEEEETYDARRYPTKERESFDLRDGNVELSSSPLKYSYESSYEDEFIRRGIKKEDEEKRYIEISDDEDIVPSLPTPKTLDSKYKTPNIRKRLELEAPIETPSKKSKLLLLSKESSKIKDLTINYKQNREWILEDFKINPEKNNNLSFAYSIALRDKSSRSCVHGKTCINCEKFYKLLADIPNYELLGPQWNNESIKEMSKNFKVISKTSRHKELWEAPESLPGFREFDFPTTQELIKNKEIGELRNKRVAYERLYSSLNDKKFLFKDEEYNQLVNSGLFKVDESIFLKYLKRE